MSGFDASRIVRRADRAEARRASAALPRVELARRLALAERLAWKDATAFAAGAALPKALASLSGPERFDLLVADPLTRADPGVAILLAALGVDEAAADQIFEVPL